MPVKRVRPVTAQRHCYAWDRRIAIVLGRFVPTCILTVD